MKHWKWLYPYEEHLGQTGNQTGQIACRFRGKPLAGVATRDHSRWRSRESMLRLRWAAVAEQNQIFRLKVDKSNRSGLLDVFLCTEQQSADFINMRNLLVWVLMFIKALFSSLKFLFAQMGKFQSDCSEKLASLLDANLIHITNNLPFPCSFSVTSIRNKSFSPVSCWIDELRRKHTISFYNGGLFYDGKGTLWLRALKYQL